MDLEKLLIASVSFLGGLLAGLLKVIFPPYTALLEENRHLRTELMERLDGLLDIVQDTRESNANQEPPGAPSDRER